MNLTEKQVKWIIMGLDVVRQSVRDNYSEFGIKFEWDKEMKFEDDVIAITNQIAQLQKIFRNMLENTK
jgi:hypothetical protein